VTELLLTIRLQSVGGENGGYFEVEAKVWATNEH